MPRPAKNRRKLHAVVTPEGTITLTLDPTHKRFRVRDLARETTGHHPSPPTIYRWVRGIGATGLRLPAIALDGAWYTTREAWEAWLEARSRIKLGLPIDASDAELLDAGLVD